MFRSVVLCVLAVLLVLSAPASAATKIFFQDATSPLGVVATGGAGIGCYRLATNRYIYRTANTVQGSAAVTKTFAPTVTAPPCLWQTASGAGDYVRFITAPVSAAVTISSNINYQAGCAENNTTLNGGFRFVVYRWSRAKGGIDATIMTSATSTECAGANIAIAAAAPTSTVLAIGDRLVFDVQVMNVGTWGGNSSRTVSLVYGAATTVYGDTFANFVDDISFASDVNNARAVVR